MAAWSFPEVGSEQFGMSTLRRSTTFISAAIEACQEAIADSRPTQWVGRGDHRRNCAIKVKLLRQEVVQNKAASRAERSSRPIARTSIIGFDGRARGVGVRFGSFADFGEAANDVRFNLTNRHRW